MASTGAESGTVERRSFCRICLAYCGIVARVEGDQVVAIRGDATDPVSAGYVCPKGRSLGALHHERRLTGALLGRGPDRRTVSIDEGLDDAARALQVVFDEHGPEAIGVFSGTGGFNDPMAAWAIGRLKAALGVAQSYSTSTVDAVSKTLVGYLMAGTASLIPHPDPDLRLMLLLGSNPVVSHGQSTPFANPIERIRAVRDGGEVWVVDPRRTETAALADRHLAARPGTDHAVLAFLVRDVLTDADRPMIAERAEGVDELADLVAPYTASMVAAMTGLTVEELDDLAAAVRRAGRLAVITGTGTTMARSAPLTEWMAWALMIVTDSFDRPGGMWFNPGYHLRLDQRRPLRPQELKPGPPSRPDIPSMLGEWPSALIPEEIESGRLRALIVVGGNPGIALPDATRLHRALEQLDVLLVVDITETVTTAPATHAFGSADQLERADIPSSDLFGSSLVSRFTEAVVPADPERPEMWRLFAALAARMGHPLLEEGEDPATLATETLIARVRPTVDIEALRAAGGVSVAAPAIHGWVQEHLPWGVWRLAPAQLAEQLAAFRPPPDLQLAPRRQTRRINGLECRPGDEPAAVLHPEDARRAGVSDGEMVEVASEAGALRLVARVTDGVAVGTVSIPHGWGQANVNTLVSSTDLDPLTGMPVSSGTAVRVSPVNAPSA
jgi:anaerobic selenocysteine-containing dehydrogenase